MTLTLIAIVSCALVLIGLASFFFFVGRAYELHQKTKQDLEQ